MKLRDFLRITSLLVLLYVVVAIPQLPVIVFIDKIRKIDQVWAGRLDYFYSEVNQWINVVTYSLFVICMMFLDSRFPKARFGRFFLFDALILIASVITFREVDGDNNALLFWIKISYEIALSISSLLAGFYIFKFFKNKAMLIVFISYLILMLRHILFAIILYSQNTLFTGVDKTLSEIQTNQYMMTLWGILTPMLVFSRILLFYGIRNMSVLTKRIFGNVREISSEGHKHRHRTEQQ